MGAQRFDDLAAFSAEWRGWMWEMAWQVAVLVLVILAMGHLLRQRSARLRHLLWLLVLVRLVVPPFFAAPTGIRWWIADPEPEPRQVAAVGGPTDSRPVDASPALATPLRSPGLPASPRMLTRSRVPLTTILMLVWTTLVTCGFGLFVVGWFRVRAWVGKATPIVDQRFKRRISDRRKPENPIYLWFKRFIGLPFAAPD